MEENQNRDEGKIERIKEEIHYRIEIIKLTAVFLLTALGGEISLFLQPPNIKRLILLILGIPVIILLGGWLWLNHRKVNKLLALLEEKGNV